MISKITEREKHNPSDYWKRFTEIKMIRASILIPQLRQLAAQCFLNIRKNRLEVRHVFMGGISLTPLRTLFSFGVGGGGIALLHH